jgi:hypothetical protein
MKLPDHTKVWSNIAYLAASICFVKANWASTAPSEIWVIYLSIVGLHVTADKFVQLRYGQSGGSNP